MCAEARFTWSEHGRRRRIIPASSWPPDSGSTSADDRPGAARAVARKSRSRELAHYMVHHDLPNSPITTSGGSSSGSRWPSSMSTEGEPPCSPPLPARDGTVVWCQFDRAVVLSDPLLLSRGDVLCLSLTTGRSSSARAAFASGSSRCSSARSGVCRRSRVGITYARFGLSGCPSRWRS